MKDIQTLLRAHLEGEISPEDRLELDQWVNESSENRAFFQELNDPVVMTAWLQKMQSYDEQMIWQKIRDGVSRNDSRRPVRRLERKWVRYAAVVILLAGLGTWYGIWRQQQFRRMGEKDLASSAPHEIPAPTMNKAVLTLAGGQQLVLDSAGNGALTTQGKVAVVKTGNGQIAYQGQSANPGTLVYNELTVPRGSRIISLQLTDGTKVWLNAASSLRYPVAFASSDRTVEISGEAYFEVAKDPGRPFRVRIKGRADGAQINVLGTSFNINAYADEPLMKATLVDGKVQVEQDGQSGILSPGQQAQVSGKGNTAAAPEISIIDHANVQQATAWKDGNFSFEQTDLPTIMRQLIRWYDIEVEFMGTGAGKQFGGEIPRNSNLSQVLEMLTIAGVHFEVRGKKVIVLP